MNKNSPASAKDTSLIPGLGRFHAVEQLSSCATATEAHTQYSQQAAATDPHVPTACAPQQKPPQREAPLTRTRE